LARCSAWGFWCREVGNEHWAIRHVSKRARRSPHLTRFNSRCRGGSAHHPTSRRIFAAFNTISSHATHPRNKPTRHSQPAQLPCAIIAHSHSTPINIYPQRREGKNLFVRPFVLIRLRTPQATLTEKPGERFPPSMDTSRLVPGAPDRKKQVQDAKDMYQIIARNAERTGSEPPPYKFLELIGKGTFGRVYKW
jgi:hypothetical protein